MALDVTAMAAAAALLVGTRDFSAFGVMEKGDPRSVVRRLRRLVVRATDGHQSSRKGSAAILYT